MTGAIEFLLMAKAVCNKHFDKGCEKCPLIDEYCIGYIDIKDEADLVRKVMKYRLEDKDAVQSN